MSASAKTERDGANLTGFSILPVCSRSPRRAARPPWLQPMHPHAAAPLSILVAEDEEGIRDLLAHWLSDCGHRVQTVDGGQQALRHLHNENFDLVITDVVMPDGDGFELIPAIRKIQPEARILAISGGGRYIPGGDCLSLARGLGAHATVIKPFDSEDVRRGIAVALSAASATKSA